MSDPKLGLIISAQDLTKKAFLSFQDSIKKAADSTKKIKAAGKNFDAVVRKVKTLDDSLTSLKGRVSAVGKSMMSLQGGLLTLTAGYGLQQTASAALDVASSFEQMERKLDVLTKGEGPETLDRLNAWAKDMPVNTRDAVDSFVLMQAMGLDPTIKKMQTLTDVSSIFGGDTMHGVARALGQMVTNGRLLGEELNQLSERGVNARKILMDHFGMTIKEIQDSGKDIHEIVDAIWQGLDANYGGAAQSAMDSWQGLVAIFQSTLTEGTRQVMDAGLFDYLKTKLGELNTGMKSWLDTNQDFIKNDLPGHIDKITSALGDLGKGALWVGENFLRGVSTLKAFKDYGDKNYNDHLNMLLAKQEAKRRKKAGLPPTPERHAIADTRVNDDAWSGFFGEKEFVEIPVDIKKLVTDLDFASDTAKQWRDKLQQHFELPLDINMDDALKSMKYADQQADKTFNGIYNGMISSAKKFEQQQLTTKQKFQINVAEMQAAADTFKITNPLKYRDMIDQIAHATTKFNEQLKAENLKTFGKELEKVQKTLVKLGKREVAPDEDVFKDIEKLKDFAVDSASLQALQQLTDQANVLKTSFSETAKEIADLDQQIEKLGQKKAVSQEEIDTLKSVIQDLKKVAKTQYEFDILDQAEQKLTRLEERFTGFKGFLIDLSESTSQAMSDTFSNVFFDAMTNDIKKAEHYFKNFLSSISRFMANFLSQQMTKNFMNMFGSAVPAGGAPLLPSTGGNVALAGGGIIDEHIVGYGLKSGTRYELGESGPEAVLPMSRMKKGGGGADGVTSVKINITNNSGQPIEQKSVTQEINGQEMIISAVIDGIERNVGGIRSYMRV